MEKKIVFKSIQKGSKIKKPVIERNINLFDHESEQEAISTDVYKDRKEILYNNQGIVSKLSLQEINNAIKQDPNIFDYDNSYDEINSKRQVREPEKSKNPKYAHNLILSAEFRKREQDRRMERKIQKERDNEDPSLKDTEVFVTDAYRKKLEEREEEDINLKIKEIQDEQFSATFQGGMNHFYRNFILEQNLVGKEDSFISKEINKRKLNTKNIKPQPVEESSTEDETEEEEEEPLHTIEIETKIKIDLDDPEGNVESQNNILLEELEPLKDEIIESSVEIKQPKQKKDLFEFYKRKSDEKTIKEARERYFERQKLNLIQQFIIN